MEAVAETTEENMEKFFAGEPFTKEEIMKETDPTKRRQLISENMDLFE
jgi:hypothetical protein